MSGGDDHLSDRRQSASGPPGYSASVPDNVLPASAAAPVVLMVDDHADSLEIYEILLRSTGFTPLTARTAEEAFAQACSGRPDVVVADVTLPGVSGVELVRQLRADARTRDTGVIVLTGHGAEQMRRDAEAAGCDRYLLKPCLPDVLTAGIRDMVTLRRHRAEVTAAVWTTPSGE